MSGIERLPSLLGNFPISEFGFRLALRCLFLGLSPLDVTVLLSLGCLLALCFFLLFASFRFDYMLYSFLWFRSATLFFYRCGLLVGILDFFFFLLENVNLFLVFSSFVTLFPQLYLLTPLLPLPLLYFSYRDLLELKEIQRSLPHANQPPDTVTGRPGKQFLLGVPIVLLPLLSSNPTESTEHGAQEAAAKKLSDAPGRSNASGTGWGSPSLKRQVQATPPQPFVPFPPRPPPRSIPSSGSSAPKSTTFTSAPTSPSSISHPLHMNSQVLNKTGSPPPSSPTAPFPSSYSNRPSTTSKYPYSSFHQVQQQPQSRASWTPPSSLSHLMPSLPVKPREKPKFEFITLLDSGGKKNGSPDPSSEVDADHETEGRGAPFLKRSSANSSLSSSYPSDVGLPIKKKPEAKKKKEKERKFILVNDMEIELDEDSGSESEEESTPSSGSITSTSTTSNTTREVTTTTTRMTTSTTEKTTTTITTTTSSERRPSSPLSIMAPVPVKSTTTLGSGGGGGGTQSSPLTSSPSLLLTPPTTPPRGSNKSLHSPSSSPSTAASRGGVGRLKKTGGVLMGSSTSRERSGSITASGGGGGGTTSPSRNGMTGICLPVKFKSNTCEV